MVTQSESGRYVNSVPQEQQPSVLNMRWSDGQLDQLAVALILGDDVAVTHSSTKTPILLPASVSGTLVEHSGTLVALA
jgi:hypothetical protein